jgi:hypothetical protein
VILDDKQEAAVRAWLAAGPRDLPEPYLEMALDEISSTSQQRWAWPAWGPQRIGALARVALVTAALGLLAIGGWVVGAGQHPGPALVLESPSASASLEASPSPGFERRSADAFSVPFDYVVPLGARSEEASPDEHEIELDQYGVSALSDVRLYADPCHWTKGYADVPANATPLDLAMVVHELPGYSSILPEPIMVDGHPGVRVDFRYTGTGDCDLPMKVRLADIGEGGNETISVSGIQQRWLIVDVAGTRVILEEWSLGVGLAYRLPELDRIIESVRFQ